jgi:hypothetical protein
MSAASLLEILEVYFEAFAETDPARRAELLARCIADKGILGRDIAADPGIVAASPRGAPTTE